MDGPKEMSEQETSPVNDATAGSAPIDEFIEGPGVTPAEPAVDAVSQEMPRLRSLRAGQDGEGLRERTARGVVVNSAFQVGFAALTLVQRLVVATFLTVSQFGIWGLLLTVFITLGWLKQVGIGDKYIQQEEPDQELAFQRAFTLELGLSIVFGIFLAAMLPVYAVIYGHSEIIGPGLILCLAVIVAAFQTPIWISFRRMQFVRQRVLEGINPIVSLAVMAPLAVAGAGYWSIVAGLTAGTVASAGAAVATSPYRLALRFERAVLKEYTRFSWPLFLSSFSTLVMAQGVVIIANLSVGLVGVGALTLAGSFIVFADRVDGIISRTIYPAICAVKDRVDLLAETFVKSNRLALMWGLPFGWGLFLFAPDLVTFVLGDKWQPAVGIMQALGVIVGLRQVAFNWNLFMNATGDTRPVAVNGVLIMIVFLAVTGPLLAIFGLTGYVVGMSVSLVVELTVRGHYLRRLFPGFRLLRHLARAVAPSIPAVAAVAAVRALTWGSTRTAGQAAAEFALYVVVTVAGTMFFERRLLRELVGYVMRRRRTAAHSAGVEQPLPG
jgi:O-antigen/teichoic acid export membrane protein